MGSQVHDLRSAQASVVIDVVGAFRSSRRLGSRFIHSKSAGRGDNRLSKHNQSRCHLPLVSPPPLSCCVADVVGLEDGLGVECLSGSGAIAGIYTKAFREGFTITLVSGRTVGIGAYLARLGRRYAKLFAAAWATHDGLWLRHNSCVCGFAMPITYCKSSAAPLHAETLALLRRDVWPMPLLHCNWSVSWYFASSNACTQDQLRRSSPFSTLVNSFPTQMPTSPATAWAVHISPHAPPCCESEFWD